MSTHKDVQQGRAPGRRNSNGMRAGALALLLTLLGIACPASADLMIFPTRVVFDERTRTAQVDLMNTSTESATYRIGFAQRRMNEFGNFTNIDAALPGELFADKLIRYSPRQVTLAPGAGQTVRLLLRKPADLADGEYRSHLVFERVQEAPAAASTANAESSEEAPPVDVQIRLSAMVSVSIPVIVHHGNTSATVQLTTPHLLTDPADGSHAIAFDLQRDGNRSVYGDITAFYTPPEGGTAQVVAQAKGVALYAPYLRRHIRLAPGANAPALNRQGRLRIEFRARPEDRRVLLGSVEGVF